MSVDGMAHFASAHVNAAGGRDYAAVDASAVGEVPSTAKCFAALQELQKEGKIKQIGVSNFGVKQLTEALESGVTISVNQLCYNLLFRAIEFEILPFCVKHNIQVICYSPLQQGLLTGKWKDMKEVRFSLWFCQLDSLKF